MQWWVCHQAPLFFLKSEAHSREKGIGFAFREMPHIMPLKLWKKKCKLLVEESEVGKKSQNSLNMVDNLSKTPQKSNILGTEGTFLPNGT